ncbi:small acid-soluble spore protein P [Paenibacillus sp. YPG26]|uniref:small acid-soluble spore protein P n=1 Tax=Paenibacillus sp. YPG26 TaxID=2878915 RepID=UPI00203F77B0|nr:small acid-soluble spore protein P [Paenibacillus sp. YPG26]USB33346.1 small acid-soluble spore protein P [Paenibacillus sp. YPG26]
MSKPKTVAVPGVQPDTGRRRKEEGARGPEPLSGSKKVKNRNHVDHHNRQGG